MIVEMAPTLTEYANPLLTITKLILYNLPDDAANVRIGCINIYTVAVAVIT